MHIVNDYILLYSFVTLPLYAVILTVNGKYINITDSE